MLVIFEDRLFDICELAYDISPIGKYTKVGDNICCIDGEFVYTYVADNCTYNAISLTHNWNIIGGVNKSHTPNSLWTGSKRLLKVAINSIKFVNKCIIDNNKKV